MDETVPVQGCCGRNSCNAPIAPGHPTAQRPALSARPSPASPAAWPRAQSCPRPAAGAAQQRTAWLLRWAHVQRPQGAAPEAHQAPAAAPSLHATVTAWPREQAQWAAGVSAPGLAHRSAAPHGGQVVRGLVQPAAGRPAGYTVHEAPVVVGRQPHCQAGRPAGTSPHASSQRPRPRPPAAPPPARLSGSMRRMWIQSGYQPHPLNRSSMKLRSAGAMAHASAAHVAWNERRVALASQWRGMRGGAGCAGHAELLPWSSPSSSLPARPPRDGGLQLINYLCLVQHALGGHVLVGLQAARAEGKPDGKGTAGSGWASACVGSGAASASVGMEPCPALERCPGLALEQCPGPPPKPCTGPPCRGRCSSARSAC